MLKIMRNWRAYIALSLVCIMCFSNISPVTAATFSNDEKSKLSATNAFPSYLAHYPLLEDINDISGNGKNATAYGTTTYTDGLTLPGGVKTSATNASYVRLPDGLFDQKDAVTVSVWLKNNTAAGNYCALFFGTVANASSLPENYWLFNPTNNFKSVFTNSASATAPWGTEVGLTSPSMVGNKGIWTHYTTVITADSITGYLNGVKLSTVAKTRKTSDFGTGLQAYIGRSNYLGDTTLAGSFQDLRIYDGALDDTQVAVVYEDTDYVNANVTTLLLQKLKDKLTLEDLLENGAVTSEGLLALPETVGNAAVTWSSDNTAVIANDGQVTLPQISTVVNLTATLTLNGATDTKVFAVNVISLSEKGEYYKDLLRIPNVLDKLTQLPTQIGDATIAWSGDAAVSSNGALTTTFEGSKKIHLIATLSVTGLAALTKEFDATLFGQDAKYILSYTRTPLETNLYSEKLAYSMHLGYSQDGLTYTGLNNNTGVLFAKAISNTNGTLTPKSLKNPYLFYLKDASFGVVATRTEAKGTVDTIAPSSVLFFKSTDLLKYEEVGLIDLKTDKQVLNPVCEYDIFADTYRITWCDESGNYYENTLDDLSNLSGASDPVISTKADTVTADTSIVGAVESNVLPVKSEIADRVNVKLSKIENTSVTVPALSTVATIEDVKNIKATANYNDGSTADKVVSWDTSEVDFTKDGSYEIQGTVTQDTYSFPMIANRADPNAIKYNGKYYFIATDEDGQSKFFIRKADTVAGLGSASDNQILNGSSYTSLFINCLWAPELHNINGDLYIFFSGSLGGWNKVQSHVMKLKTGGDPTVAADWETPIRVLKRDGTNLYDATTQGITLDMTYFEVDGSSYVIWAQRQITPVDIGSWLYIASVDSSQPWKLTSDPVLVSKPDYGWDNNTTFVDEGPYVIQKGENIFVTFSGSNVDPTYVVGMLTAKKGSDLLDITSWEKGNYPILTSSSVAGQYGPGHNSYVEDDNGNLLNVFHAKNGYSGARCSSVRRVHFDSEGIPILDLTEDRDLKAEYKSVQMTLVVDSEADEVTVTYTAGTGGKIQGSAVQTVTKGSDTTEVTAVADEGYTFTKWSDGVTTAARMDKEVSESKTLTAEFTKKVVEPEQKVTVTYQAGIGGKIVGTTVQTIDKGSDAIEVTAVANDGYTFTKWSDGVTTAARTDKGVAESKTVTAEFTQKVVMPEQKVIVTYQAGAGGKIVGTAVQIIVKGGITTEVTAVADSGYVFSGWSDGVMTTSRSDKIVTENKTITALFTKTIIQPTKISINYSKVTLGVKETFTLKAVVSQAEAAQNITWTSSNKAKVKIDAKGKITAVKTGTATLTAKTTNGIAVSCKVTVKKAPSKITLNAKKKTLKKGKIYQLKVKLPSNSASNAIMYASSSKAKVTVSASGKIRAVKKGTATITVKTFNGKKAKIVVTVK